MTMRRRQLLVALPALLLPSLAAAQQQADNDPNRPDGEEFLSRLLLVIDQAGIIIPGRGFKSIAIGDSAEQLLELWGKPAKINRKNEVLTYLLQQNTLIHFKLDDGLIESIVVMGQPGSLAKVNNGVIFGMSQEQVLSQQSEHWLEQE